MTIEVTPAPNAPPVAVDDGLSGEMPKLIATDGSESDYLGSSVAISGDTMVVTAPFDDVGANPDQGSVRVFVRSGTSWTPQATLVAADGEAGDYFGYSVAVSGDTVVVGTPRDNVGANSNHGSVRVFVRSGTNWTPQATLLAADGEADDFFGSSVAVSGDTIAVGSDSDNVGANPNQGSVRVFVRSGTNWTPQATLLAADGEADDFFGSSVAVSGDTIAVGSDSDNVGANPNQGSVRVFVRSGTNWTPQATLLAADGEADDYLGSSVAVSGDSVVVGAPYDRDGANQVGSARVFVRSGTSWAPQPALVAADGETGDRFGWSVAIAGDTIVAGAPDDYVGANSQQGSVRVFVRSGTSWAPQPTLVAADGEAGDRFGYSVAVSGGTIVAGAPNDDIGSNMEQGSAYVFSFVSYYTTPQDTALTISAPGVLANDTDADGDLLAATLMTAPVHGGVALNPDGSFIYTPHIGFVGTDVFHYRAFDGTDSSNVATVTIEVTPPAPTNTPPLALDDGALASEVKVVASDGAENDFFGSAVAVSGDTMVVGVDRATVSGNLGQGAAYVFTRSGGSWVPQDKLVASDGGPGEYFGGSVAIDGDTIVVGAPGDNSQVVPGYAYVFTRSGTTWTERTKLVAADGLPYDAFGCSVAVDGATIVVGASADEGAAGQAQGSAYVFAGSGANWTSQDHLWATDAMGWDRFGGSVGVSGDTIVVGAWGDDAGAGPSQGSAYIFARSGTAWSQQDKLTASNPSADDQFGLSVAISGNTAVVGAHTTTPAPARNKARRTCSRTQVAIGPSSSDSMRLMPRS